MSNEIKLSKDFVDEVIKKFDLSLRQWRSYSEDQRQDSIEYALDMEAVLYAQSKKVLMKLDKILKDSK